MASEHTIAAMLGDVLVLTGRKPDNDVVAAYSRALSAVADATLSDVLAAATAAVRDHRVGYGLYWPSAIDIEQRLRGIVESRFSWEELAEGCDCVAGFVTEGRYVKDGRIWLFTVACDKCAAGKARHDRQGHSFRGTEQ